MAKLKKTTTPDRKFKYPKPSVESVKRRATQSGGRFDSIFKSGFDIYKPQQGENRIRFLPPTWDDPEDFSYPVWVHRRIGPDNSSYLCSNERDDKGRIIKGQCPICEAAAESKRAGEEDEAKELRAVQQFVAWIIDRKGDEDTPSLYSISWTIDKDLSSLRLGESGGVLHIAHEEVGFDVSFVRTGQGVNTRYSAWRISRDESPISDNPKVQQKIEQFIWDNPIPDVLNYYNDEYLERVIKGTSTEKDEDDDNGDGEEEERNPPRSKKRGGQEEEGEDEEVESERQSNRKRRPEPEDEPEDEDESEEDEGGNDDNSDEEEDSRGRKARPTSRERVKSRRGEPEEEEAEEDEGEDEDAPPRRSRTTDAGDVKRRRPEEEEESSEDDDEENPPPRRSSKVSGKGRR